mmetsp:Transcript_72051/g.136050  ORF Transcript_72051/g.136050 Transcript_72051/m.136050 type:complete len:273 (-) Transcript_72051:75-893(-)
MCSADMAVADLARRTPWCKDPSFNPQPPLQPCTASFERLAAKEASKVPKPPRLLRAPRTKKKEAESVPLAVETKEERKMRMLADIAQRMSKVMEEARTTGSQQIVGPALQMTSLGPKAVLGDESMMAKKRHGSSDKPVQESLRWGCDRELAERICNHNRKNAENFGYFKQTAFVKEAKKEYATNASVYFYDSNSGKPVFTAPRGRSFEEFLKESELHGWPSFRDDEVNWTVVRLLPDGEAISIHGTHLGHNLPDARGNRYCINLVSIAGRPM